MTYCTGADLSARLLSQAKLSAERCNMKKNTIENTWFKDQTQTKMSHNVYCDVLEKSEDNSTRFCNYLIYCGIGEEEKIIPCSCLETVLKIASIEKQICKVFKRAGSLGKKWDYLCDISVGVL